MTLETDLVSRFYDVIWNQHDRQAVPQVIAPDMDRELRRRFQILLPERSMRPAA